MQVCLINSQTPEGELDQVVGDGEDVPVGCFSEVSGIDVQGWLDICPIQTCKNTLRVVRDNSTYHLWCPACGWIIEDGVEITPKFMTVPELANAQNRYTDNMIRRLIDNEIIPASNFGRSTKAKYMIPIHIARDIIDSAEHGEGLSWVLI